MTQAERIFERFGGARRLASALKALAEHTGDPTRARNVATIYKWTYPRSKGGTGGYVPSSAMDDVKAAARLSGLLLRPEDWYGE